MAAGPKQHVDDVQVVVLLFGRAEVPPGGVVRVDRDHLRPAGEAGSQFAAEQCLFGVQQQVLRVGPVPTPPGVAPDPAGELADHERQDVVGQVREFRRQGVDSAA